MATIKFLPVLDLLERHGLVLLSVARAHVVDCPKCSGEFDAEVGPECPGLAAAFEPPLRQLNADAAALGLSPISLPL